MSAFPFLAGLLTNSICPAVIQTGIPVPEVHAAPAANGVKLKTGKRFCAKPRSGLPKNGPLFVLSVGGVVLFIISGIMGIFSIAAAK